MITNITKFLTKKEKISLIFLSFFILLGTILEVLGYAIIIPLLTIIIKSKSALVEFSFIKKNEYLSQFFLITSEQDLIIFTVSIMVIFFFLKNAFLICLMFYRESYFFNIKARLSKFYFQKYILKEYSEFIKNNSSYYINNILNEVAMFVEKRLRSIIFIFNETLVISFFFITLLLINLHLTLAIFLLFSIILFTFLLITKKINNKYSILRQKFDTKQIQDLNESFTLFKYLKIHQLEKVFFDNFSYSNKQVNNAGKVEIFLSEIPKNIFELTSIITIFLAIFTFFLNGGKIIDIIPFLGFLILAIARIIPSLIRISNSYQNYRFSRPVMQVLNNDYSINYQALN